MWLKKVPSALLSSSWLLPSFSVSISFRGLFPIASQRRTPSISADSSRQRLVRRNPAEVSHRFLHSSTTVGRARRDHGERDDRRKDFDRFGAWDAMLDMDLELESSIKHGKPIPKVSASLAGSSSVQGRRKTQEDRCLVADLYDGLLMAVVFDGHGGSECADFCYHWIVPIVQDIRASGDTCLQTIMHDAFTELDRRFERHWRDTIGTSSSEIVTPGTTATVCLLRGGVELVVAHVGDSRALLCRDGEARALSVDHSAALVSERRRVQEAGGAVLEDQQGRTRVDGSLSVTRSLGDVHLKRRGVTAFPDVRSLQVQHGRDAFVALTTDGVSNVLTDRQVSDLVCAARSPTDAAGQVTEHAQSAGSDDNCTCVVVPLGCWGKFAADNRASIFVSFGQTMASSSRFS